MTPSLTPEPGAPLQRTPAERAAILAAVYAQMSATALGYHSIVININVMLLSVNTFLIGYLIGSSPAVEAVPKYLLATIPAILAGSGMVATWIIRAHFLVIAAVIRRIDAAFGSFEPGYFFPGPPLYPRDWQRFGTREWHDIIFDMFIPMQALMGTVGMTLVALR